ncbi:MAG: gamma-glutamyltransferase [Polyangiaceae bacterium]|nr:gamma-glutamyltransferase [Polyangiaceae bacterium]
MRQSPVVTALAFAFAALALAGGCASGDRAGPSVPAPGLAPSPPPPAAAPPSAAAAAHEAGLLPAPVFPEGWPFRANETAARSPAGMVTSDAALATRVGAGVLASGGNAVDAAVATALALAVVYPTAGNVGGGGFAVIRASGQSYALDFRETAPAAATHDMYLAPDHKTSPDSRQGWRSAGVPGAVAGLYEAWHRLGSKRMSWAEIVAPAIALADQGFTADAEFVKAIDRVRDRLAKDAASSALFLLGGAPPAVGSTFRDPDLAALLRRVAKEGPAGFYAGPAAAAIEKAMKDHHGLVTAADLKAYTAEWRTPIEFDYRGRHVIGMPPPSSGGATMAMIAHVLAGWDLRSLGWHSPSHLHLAAEAMRRAFAARNERLGDPKFVHNPTDELLSERWAAEQRATITLDRATPSASIANGAAHQAEGTHTTHLSVVDGDGNAVALTTTINAWFGSGVTVPGLGFVLNDEMDDFATVPGTPNMFGLVQGEVNSIAPGKRMLSSMSPTIVLDGSGNVDLVLGAAGGSTIITAVFEELSNVVDFGMGVADAVRAPRFHQQDFPDVLAFEERGTRDDVVHALEAMGHATKTLEHIADAPGLGHVGSAGPLWEGAAEPRRPGGLAAGP